MRNFSIATGVTGVAIAVNTTSQAVAVATTPAAIAANDVLLDNRGAADCYVRAGLPGAVALATDVRIPAGAIMVYEKGPGNTHLAVIGAGSTTLLVHCGEGA